MEYIMPLLEPDITGQVAAVEVGILEQLGLAASEELAVAPAVLLLV
jgi:hypothetical protein